MKKMLVSVLLASALVACGSKNKSTTTPPTAPQTDAKDGSATGGATYGGTQPTKPEGSATADPCAP